MDQSPAPLPFDRIIADLRMILRGVLAAVGMWRLEPVMALVAYRRMSGSFGRIERMLVRFRAGRLWRMSQREFAPGRRARGAFGLVLPRRFGWLVLGGGHQAASCGSQLQTVLNMPEMAELLASSVQAQRILRPVCRALAVELPWTVPKALVERGQIPRHRRKPRAVLEPFRIPLPRGVLSAARRQGFGKDS